MRTKPFRRIVLLVFAIFYRTTESPVSLSVKQRCHCVGLGVCEMNVGKDLSTPGIGHFWQQLI